MRTRFSKPSQDNADKARRLQLADASLLEMTRCATAALHGRPPRERCPVCLSELDSALAFSHRGHAYRRCGSCRHIVLACLPPHIYPDQEQPGFSFSSIYPEMDAASQARRREAIYRPKLEWIIEAARELGRGRTPLLQSGWVELGCGEGQFLAALEEAGAASAKGVEADARLVERAQSLLSASAVIHSQEPLSKAVREHQADVYAAFFVLEHIADVHDFFSAFAEKAPGTLLAFSVPVFSLATVLESAFDVHAPRNLDSVLHTQLFTDASIRKCLEIGRLEMVSQWVFGQDAADLRRLLTRALAPHYPEPLLAEVDEQLAALEDPLQGLVDQSFFCDARHVLAVRREDAPL